MRFSHPGCLCGTLFARGARAMNEVVSRQVCILHSGRFSGMVTTVGWSVGDKRAERLYARDPETGEFVLDENNEPRPDADFDLVLGDLYRSAATHHFDWLLKGREAPAGEVGWSVSITNVVADEGLLLDPKRLCRKFVETRKQIQRKPHFNLSEVVEIVPEYKACCGYELPLRGNREHHGRYLYPSSSSRLATSRPSETQRESR